MPPSRPQLLRTTVVQAFARTVADESRRTAVGGQAPPSLRDPAEAPPSVVALPQVGDVVGGHYALDSVLGQGMFGKVYVAKRLDVPEHRVALKLMPRSLYVGRNVERELVMLATVGHPNVVQLKDHGTTPDYVWLTMPVYHGRTLAERLEKGTLTPRQAYDIFVPIARGLDALHAAGLRHQDVKPENIYLAVFGGRVHPIVLDLGVAAERDATFVAGTALYAAPEQVATLSGLLSLKPLSEKMDTYGLAATLLMALVGPEHFPGEAATDRIELAEAQDVRTREPIGPGALVEVEGDARAALSAAFRRWLAHDPDERPTMAELADQLEVLLEPEREEERIEARRQARQGAALARLRVVLGAMLLIGAAGAAVAYTRRKELTVAGELAVARAEGAASFTKLDTCVASYQMASRDVAECRAAREKELGEARASLEEVMRSGSTSEAEHAHQVERYNAKVKACQDSAAAAARTCDDEMTRLVSDGARDHAELSADRDAARRLAEQERTDRAAAEAEREKLRGELRSATEERDACKAAAKAPPAPPPVPAPAVPGAAPSAAPLSPPEPRVEPRVSPSPSPVPVPPPPSQQQPAQTAPVEPRAQPPATVL